MGQGQGQGHEQRQQQKEAWAGAGFVGWAGQGVSVGVGMGGRESVLKAGHGDKEGQEAWHSKPNVVLARWGRGCGEW